MKYILPIIILATLIYSNSLQGEFVSDDIPQIVNNKTIGTLEGCRSPITCINSVIYKFNQTPIPFHILSLIVYSIACILVFYLLSSFFPIIPSFLGALLFTAHPIHTEAISWISGLPYALSTVLIIASFLLYKKRKYWLSLSLHLINFTICWYAFIFPLMIVLYDILYHRVNWKRWTPYFFLSGAWLIFSQSSLSQRISSLSGSSNPLSNLIYSFFKHGQLILFPDKLTIYHEPLTTTMPTIILGGIALIILICSLPFIRKAKPLIFGLGIYTLFLLPTYSPKMISWLIAERYAFFPSVGACIILVYLLNK